LYNESNKVQTLYENIYLVTGKFLKGIKPEQKKEPSGKSIEDFWPSAKKVIKKFLI
jgi:hypothetical protein